MISKMKTYIWFWEKNYFIYLVQLIKYEETLPGMRFLLNIYLDSSLNLWYFLIILIWTKYYSSNIYIYIYK